MSISNKYKAFFSAAKAFGISGILLIPELAAEAAVIGGLLCLGYVCGHSAKRTYATVHNSGRVIQGEVIDKK